MATESTGTKRNQMLAPDKFKLWNFVKDKYTDSRMNCIEFATLAERELGIRVTEHNVAGALETLNIPNNYPRPVKPAEAAAQEQLLLLKQIDTKLDQLIDLMTRPTTTPGG